ncbi:unnamed protein product, partial [Mycena citricolor]
RANEGTCRTSSSHGASSRRPAEPASEHGSAIFNPEYATRPKLQLLRRESANETSRARWSCPAARTFPGVSWAPIC